MTYLSDEKESKMTPENISSEKSADDWSWRSNSYAWYVVVVLTFAFTLSMVDRMILTLLVGPIKQDLGLSDTELSLLHGMAFTLLYVFCGFPLGRLADSRSRRSIAGVSIFFWSLMTAACAMAGNFWQLFLARVGVGVGEAGLSPAATSLIGDYFPEEKLARPMTFLSVGGSAGAGLAFIFGGVVVHFISGIDNVTLPIIGEMYAWQVAFLVVGLPGVFFAFVFITIREPARKGRTNNSSNSVPVSVVTSFIRERAGFFFPHFLGASCSALVLIGIHSWMPTFFIRTHGWSAEQSGYIYGVVVLVFGVLGLLASGMWVERLAKKGLADSHLHVAFYSIALAFIPSVIAPLMPTAWLTIIFVSVAIFFLVMPIALAPVALQIVVPNEMRGQAFALHLFILSILGYAAGPTVVAVFTDFIFKDESLVGYSLSLLSIIGLSFSAYFINRTRNFTWQNTQKKLVENG